MARLIVPDSDSTMVAHTYNWWQIALLGASIGVLQWGLSLLIGGFVVDQILCRSTTIIASCAQSAVVAGNIATIMTSVIGLVVLVRMRVLRPIVVVVASAVLLWSLPVMSAGLAWGEVVFWSALLYGLAYSVFAWFSRYVRTIPVLLATTAVIALMLIIVRL